MNIFHKVIWLGVGEQCSTKKTDGQKKLMLSILPMAALPWAPLAPLSPGSTGTTLRLAKTATAPRSRSGDARRVAAPWWGSRSKVLGSVALAAGLDGCRTCFIKCVLDKCVAVQFCSIQV